MGKTFTQYPRDVSFRRHELERDQIQVCNCTPVRKLDFDPVLLTSTAVVSAETAETIIQSVMGAG